MELDLRPNGKLPIEYCRYISEIEEPTRLKYNEYTSNLITSNSIKSMGWFNRLTCRNTHLSNLLHCFCRIELLKYALAANKGIDRVRVDSFGMYKASQRIVKSMNSGATVVLSKSNSVNSSPISNFLKSCYKLANSFIWPKLFGVKKIPNEKIIYLDTFLFIDSFDANNTYQDRYYPGIEKLVKDKNKIWYSPTLIGINHPKNFYHLFKAIRSSSKQFLIKEEWLKFSDYISAIFLSFTLTRTITSIPLLDNLKIEELVNEEIRKDKFSMDIINPILIYLFIKRLKMSNIEIELVVDWNENQVIDRALIMGIRKFYSDTRIHGYQGYIVPDFYACKDPTVIEYESKTLPDEIFVIGKKFIEDKKKYCSSLSVSVAPAFRFSEIKKIKREPKKISNTIILILPISIKESKEIINIGLKLNKLIGNEYDFYLKQHPTYTREKLFKVFPEIKNSSIKILNKGLYSLLSETKLLISSSSSVCIEASIIGIKVAIIGSRSGPAMNPLKALEGFTNWQVCYTEKEVLNLLLSPTIKVNIETEDYLSSVQFSSLLQS
jgi:hypothetical protein